MTKAKAETVAIRVPMAFIERAKALLPGLQVGAWGYANKLSEAAVIRLALGKGLDALESRERGDYVLHNLSNSLEKRVVAPKPRVRLAKAKEASKK